MTKLENLLIGFYGVITVLIFFLVVFVGGYLYPENSVLFNEISYFISPYTPAHHAAIPYFQLYNLALTIFSLVLSLRMRIRRAKFGALCLAFSGLIGLMLVRFPMDPPATALTNVGMLHITLVMILSLYIVTALVLFGKAFRYMQHFYWLSWTSYFVAFCMVVSAIVTGALAVMYIPIGLIEKLPIGLFLLWVLLVAYGFQRSAGKKKKKRRHTLISPA